MLRPITLLFLLLIYFKSFSQRLLLDTYTPANGLVDSRITKVFQDSKGRMYFLTRDGFSIFDGQHFDNYTSVDGIPVGLANGILENADQSITVFSFAGHMFVVKNNKARVDSSRKKQFAELNQVIRLGKNDVLFLTNYKIFREKDNQLNTLDFSIDGRPHSLYFENVVVHDSCLIFNSVTHSYGQQLILYNYEKQRVLDILNRNRYIHGIKTDQHGSVFFADTAWRQLDETALRQGKLRASEPWFKKMSPPGFEYAQLDFDNENNFWLIDPEKGAISIHEQTGEKKYYAVSDGLITGVTSVFQDKERNYWFLTTSLGVQKLQQSNLTQILEINNRRFEFAWVVNRTAEGDIFISASKGIFLKNRVEPQSSTAVDPSFCYWQDEIWKMKDHKIFYGNKGTEIDFGKLVQPYRSDFQMSYRPVIDQLGRLVIPGSNLFVIDRQYNPTAVRLPYFADDVVVDQDNNYWCFTRSNYAVKLSWKEGKLETVFTKYILGLNPRCAIQWDANSFLVGTRHDGIVKISIKGDSVSVISLMKKTTGLSNDFVFTLLRTGDNELLVGTATGLDMIRFASNDTIVERISAKNNVFSSFFALAMDKEGVIYAKTEGGNLFRYDRSISYPSSFSPELSFRSITVNGNNTDYGKHQAFNYRNNNFIFSVSAPTFLDNRNSRYVFVLSGVGKQWEQDSPSPEFSINNLGAGEYKLTCTAVFAGKIYEDKTVSWTFTIRQPFWKTWWFIVMSAAVFILTIVLLVRSYFKRQLEKQRISLEKQKAIEKERTRIATDMHDDFGASLSRIKFLSEKLQLQSNGEYNELGKISAYSDEMAEKMGEIVWALNQRYDSTGDLVSFCRSYASEYLEDKSIKLDFTSDTLPHIKINGELRRNIFLVMKESLHNIVKHAQASRVRIDMQYEKEFSMTIHDNGRGFDPAAVAPFSNGIENMKKRIEEIGGHLFIQSDNGTKISIEIPAGILQNGYR